MTQAARAPDSPSVSPPASPLGGALAWRARRTWFALLLERFGAPLLPLFLVCGAFVALAWAGLFERLEAPLRMALGMVTLAALAWFARPLRTLRLPTWREVAHKLDASRPEAHRPLETLADENSTPEDPIAAALWREHQHRAARAAHGLSAQKPDARLRFSDPLALRAGVTLALLASAFVAGSERADRLAFAMDWSSARAPLVPPRLDVWLDPPAYTGRAPLFLTQNGTNAEGVIKAPVGSTLSVRMAGRREGASANLSLDHGAGLVAEPPPKTDASKPDAFKPDAPKQVTPPGVSLERRILTADTTLVIRQSRHEVAQFTLSAIPDLPPEVNLREVQPQAASPDRQTAVGLRVTYEMKDDYAIAKAEVVMDASTRRTLYPAPLASLPLNLGPGDLLIPTEDHPWAGAEVSLHIAAQDDPGQKAQSEARKVVLPARPFSQPLARALVEQRRALVFAPDAIAPVLLALDAMLFAPENFTPNAGDFIALTAIRAGLRRARDDDDLRRVAEALYDYARYIEDGELSEAEKRLREAEARLRDAIDRNAPPEEINRLAQEMRRAMDNYLRDLARKAEQDPNAKNDKPDPNAKFISPQDLARMLQKIEEAARRGDTAEAQRLLNQLRDTLKQLQSARRQQGDPGTRELGEQMRELEKLQREQRDLKDRTYRQEREGQSGNKPQNGQDSLSKEQQGLRQRLGKLRERMQGPKGQQQGQEKGQGQEKRQGQEKGQGLEDADKGMGEAQGKLGQGQPGEAIEGQQKALDGMGRAAEGLAREMERQMGQGETGNEGQDGLGDMPGPGERGRAENSTDPLGRPQARDGNTREDQSKTEVPGKDALQGSVAERAERVLRELRRRLGEFERPRDELDYLERLLKSQQ